MHPLLLQLQSLFPSCLILAYCDDLWILGPPSDVSNAYKKWKNLYATHMEGELRDDKGKSYSPILTETTVRSHGLPNEIPFSSDGVSALGIPIGKQQFVHAYLNDKIILKSIEDLQTIQRMPLIQAQHVLLTKSICHRLNHLWRLIPTIDVTNIHGNDDLPSLG